MRTQRQLEAIEELKQWIKKYDVEFEADDPLCSVYAVFNGIDGPHRLLWLKREILFKDETE